MADYVRIEIRGTNRVRNQLRAAASFHPEISDDVISKHAKREQKHLRKKPYPPKLPNQKYIRKKFFGGIAGSFRTQRVKKGVWEILNTKTYAIWVIRKGQQNREFHEGRWWTMEETLQDRMPKLTKELSLELEDTLDKTQ